MRKLILIPLILLLIMGTVFSVELLSRQDRTISFNSTKEDVLKTTNNINEINIDIGQTICNEKKCKTEVFQEGLINTFHLTNKYNYTENWEDVTISREVPLNDTHNETIYYNESVLISVTETLRTREEIRSDLDRWLKSRIENYADVQQERISEKEVIDDGGVITRR